MKKDLTLLVLAAGMGSRFGGLKQIEPVGPNGEFIIDYSIKDAILAGFNKVVFVIKEENFAIFQETVGKRIANKIQVEYAFQKLSDVPDDVTLSSERVKPLGTAHALYATRNIIKERFAIINADDFYGRDAYIKAALFLNNCKDDEYANVAYEIGKTLTDNGKVKRGIIFAEDDYLDRIVESSVAEIDGLAVCEPLEGGEKFTVSLTQPCSMNLFCLTPKIFNYLENTASEFFKKNTALDSEWLLPNVVFESANELGKKIKVVTTTSKQYGMTYKEDLETLKKGINEEIEKGIYNQNLWS